MRSHFFGCFVCAVVVLCTVTAWAQIPAAAKCGPDAPIVLSNPQIQMKEGNYTSSVDVANTGQRPISAVIVRWRYFDSGGGSSDSVTVMDLAMTGSSLKPQEKSSMFGGSFRISKPGVVTPVQSAEVSCETVLFESPDLWGNKSLPEVRDIKNMRMGVRLERTRLLNTYRKSRVDAVLNELNKPVVQ